MPVNEFAVPRMEPGKQRPVQSMEEARDWERLFIGEIKAGRDPRRPRTPRKSTDVAPRDVASLLDAYVERCVKPAALKSVRSICSRISVLKEHLGELPLDALEEADDINRFKTEPSMKPRHLLEEAFPLLGEPNRVLADVIWAELGTVGLVKHVGLDNSGEGEAVTQPRLTDLGDRFVRFISDPLP